MALEFQEHHCNQFPPKHKKVILPYLLESKMRFPPNQHGEKKALHLRFAYEVAGGREAGGCCNSDSGLEPELRPEPDPQQPIALYLCMPTAASALPPPTTFPPIYCRSTLAPDRIPSGNRSHGNSVPISSKDTATLPAHPISSARNGAWPSKGCDST